MAYKGFIMLVQILTIITIALVVGVFYIQDRKREQDRTDYLSGRMSTEEYLETLRK